MRQQISIFLLATTAVVASGCPKTPENPGEFSPTYEEFTQSIVEDTCANLLSCDSPLSMLGTQERCERFLRNELMTNSAEFSGVANGTVGFDSLYADECVQAFTDGLTCGSLAPTSEPAACKALFTGTARIGEACADTAECIESYCNRGPSPRDCLRGTCVAFKAAGAACERNEECGELTCNRVDDGRECGPAPAPPTPPTFTAAGGACEGTDECGPSGLCIASVCRPIVTVAEGFPCGLVGTTVATCNPLDGFYCNSTGAEPGVCQHAPPGQCVPAPLRMAGTGGCDAEHFCRGVEGETLGTCAALIADHESCDSNEQCRAGVCNDGHCGPC